MNLLGLAALLGTVSGTPDAEALIRNVVANQRRVERSLPAHTYDQHVLEVTYGSDGRPRSPVRKVYAVSSPGAGGEGSRELMEIDGRPATAEEKRKAAEEDAKNRRKRIDRRAAAQAANPHVQGEEDDPLLGPRHLSEILPFFDYALEGEEIHEGRRCFVLSFRPKPGVRTRSVGDRALAALTGRVVIDAQDLQVRSATASLVRPVKVAGGIAANVRDGSIQFEAQRLEGGYWAPSEVEMRLKGTTALLFRLDKGWSFRMENFRRFAVAVESRVRRGAR